MPRTRLGHRAAGSSPTATPSASRRSRRSSATATTSSSARPIPSTWQSSRSVLARVRENGFVYEGTYEGWYCPRCADFKAENEDRRGQPLSHPPHRAHPRAGGELLLPASPPSRSRLERLYAEREDFVAPRTRYNEALSFIRSGLHDVPLTRHKLTWGVPVPVGPRARLLRLVRRAAQLLLRALLRAGPRRGILTELTELLAGELPPDRARTSCAFTPSTGRLY